MRKHIFMRLHQNRKTRYICGAQKVEDFTNEFSSSKNDQKTIKKRSKNDQKTIKKRSKNHQKIIKKSSKNHQKIIKKCTKKCTKKSSKNFVDSFCQFAILVLHSAHNFNIFTNNIIHQNNIISPPQQKNETTCTISYGRTTRQKASKMDP